MQRDILLVVKYVVDFAELIILERVQVKRKISPICFTDWDRIREEILEGVFVELYNSIVKNKYMTNLLDLRLDGTINKEVYLNKEKELNEKIENIKKEKLLILEQQNDQTERKIKEIEKIVLGPNVIKEFDGDIFESMIEKIIIGRINEKKRKRAKCYKIHLKNRRKL